MGPEILEDVAEEVVEEFTGYPWEADFLTDSEWWDMAFDVVSRSFSYVFANDFLRMFATLALLIVVVNLMGDLFRVGRRL